MKKGDKVKINHPKLPKEKWTGIIVDDKFHILMVEKDETKEKTLVHKDFLVKI